MTSPFSYCLGKRASRVLIANRGSSVTYRRRRRFGSWWKTWKVGAYRFSLGALIVYEKKGSENWRQGRDFNIKITKGPIMKFRSPFKSYWYREISLFEQNSRSLFWIPDDKLLNPYIENQDFPFSTKNLLLMFCLTTFFLGISKYFMLKFLSSRFQDWQISLRLVYLFYFFFKT